MTEDDWLRGTDFTAHVRFVHDRLSPRRRRLLAVAFCRAAGDPLGHPDLATALDVIDRYADGDASGAEVERARHRCRVVALETYEAYRNARDAWREVFADGTRDAATALARCSELAWAVAYAAATLPPVADVGTRAIEAAVGSGAAVLELAAPDPAERDTALAAWHGAMRAVVWEVVGNPFRTTHFAPEWRTDTAVALARQMYASRDFGAMPILADALQDAGCTDDELLAHCRGDAAHVRGCWAVDAVLGLE